MAPVTILLIDSDADSIAIYTLILQHHGFSVIEANDAEDGFRQAVEKKPDVVVAALYGPPVGDTSLLDRLLTDERLAETRLIILDSAPTQLGEPAETIAAVRRLTKPCEPSRLLHEVQRVLDEPQPLPR
ncbi:MAG: response regulator [Gemmatimonas sp.]|nr:response regulator [Gemmatimonas sp.]